MIQRMGDRAITNRADITVLVLKFQETMRAENAKLTEGPDSANFLYISFAVRSSSKIL